MKKNVVRVLALVLVALMCLSLIPLAAHAEAHVHEMATDHQDPTCVDNGFDQTYCPICNTTFSMNFIPATGVHSFIPVEDEQYLIEEGDCTHPYQYWKSCSVCQQSAEEAYGLAVDKLVEELTARKQSGEQADWETVAKDRILLLDERYKFSAGGEGHHILHVDRQEATCTSDGWKEYTWCDVCGERFNFEAIPAKGHRWNEFKVTKEATCTEDGSRERVCEVCDKKDVQVIPALGHTWTAFKVTKAATCTEDGSQERTCTVCGAKEVQVIPAAHKFGAFVVIEEPTCYASGTKEHTCTVCGHKETESIPAAHKFGEFVVTQEPTCYSTGAKERVCSVCGEKEVQWIDMAHKYENGVCVYCGEAQPEGETPSVNETMSATQETAAYETTEQPDEAPAVPENAIYISFDGNGATSGSMDAQAFEPGTSQNLTLNAFARTGYRFVGWDYMADGSGMGDQPFLDGEEVTLNSDVTLYAQWAEDPEADKAALAAGETVAFEASGVTIIFDGNPMVEGAVSGSMEDLYIPSSDEGGVNLRTNQFVHDEVVVDKDGTLAAIVFTGWNTQADGSGKYFEDKQFVSANDFTSYDTDVTLYAQWVAVQVIFDANGGSGSMDNQFISSEKHELRENTFTSPEKKDTYKFTGWDTDPNGQGQHFDDMQPVSTADIPATVVLYAQWKRNILVTYQSNVDSGSGKKSYAEPMKYPGDSITIKTLDETGIPTKANRIFIEWNTKRDGSGDSYKPGDTMVLTEDKSETPSRIMLYAQWGFEVTFDPNGGVGNMEPIKAIENQKLDLSEDAINQFYRDDYYFASWNTLKDGTGKSYADGATIPASDMTGPFTLYAQWKSSNITVSFNANGGEGTMEPQEGKVGVDLGLNANTFTRDEYVFTGWNTAADGSGKAYADGATIPGTDIKDDLTLYAQWEKAITVIFDPNGATGGVMEVQYGAFNTPLELKANGYTRDDYNFGGWNTKADGTGTDYKDKATIPASAMTGDITLYAKWDKKTFTVTYNKNASDATGTMMPDDFDKEKDAKLSANQFKRTDYIFTGWNTEAKGTGIAYTDKDTISAGKITKDITLYAQWTQNIFTVSFNANGGSGSMNPQKVEKEKTLTLEKNGGRITKVDLTFMGWNTKPDGSGKEISDGATLTVTENMTLYAQWAYAIVFYPNGGEGTMDPQIIKLNEKVLIKANTFTYINYSFDHWNTEPDDSGTSFANVGEITPKASVKLYAQWVKTSFSVNYERNGGGGLTMMPNTISKGATGTVKANAYNAPDSTKIFGEWNTRADGTGISFMPGDSIGSDDVPTDITLYAIWRDKLDIWFYPGDATGTTTVEEYPKDSAVKLPSYSTLGFEAPANQTFAGWQLGDNEEDLYKAGQKVVFGDVDKVEDDTVYTTARKVTAKWGDTITITYDPNGATASSRKLQRAAKNNDTKLATMSQIGYTYPGFEFKGWALSSGAKVPMYLDGAMVEDGFSQDTTLYAVWEQHTFAGIVTISGNVSGSKILGFVGETLTAVVSGEKVFTNFSYQWKRDGVDIENATAETFVPTAADFECLITCEVTANDALEGKTKLSINSKFIDVEDEEVKDIVNNGEAEVDVVYGVYDGMYYSVNNGAKHPVTSNLIVDGAFTVNQQGVYRFFTSEASNIPVGTVFVYNWWTIGFNSSTGTGDNSGSGTVTMKRGSTTLSGSTIIKDSSGDVILQPYSYYGYSNVWIVRQDAGITDITMTVKPSSGSYGHVALNGGSYDSNKSEKTYAFGNITGPMMYDVIFNKTSTSPKTGDMSHLGLWSGLCLTSFVGAASILGSARKRKKEQD